MWGAQTEFNTFLNVGKRDCLSECHLKDEGTEATLEEVGPSLPLATLYGLRPQEPKKKAYMDCEKSTRWLRQGDRDSGVQAKCNRHCRGRETTRLNLRCKRITVSTYRKQTWVLTGRQVGDYHFFCTNDGSLGREKKSSGKMQHVLKGMLFRRLRVVNNISKKVKDFKNTF